MNDDAFEVLRLSLELERARATTAAGHARQAEAHDRIQREANRAELMEAMTAFFAGNALSKEVRRVDLHDWLARRPHRDHPNLSTHEEYS